MSSSGNYHSRPSHFPDPSTGLTAAASRLVDKQREWQAFTKIHQQSTDLLKYFDQFSDKYDILDGGSEGMYSRRRDASFQGGLADLSS